MLPGIDGLEVCRRLRAVSEVPILMLTAKEAIEDRVAGLDAGADDYLVKPFAFDELMARVRALLEQQVRKSGNHALMATMPMSRVGRAKERGETDGFMKVLVEADSKQILGAAIFGIEGDEVIHMFIQAMNARLPYPAIERAMPIHPTVAELLPTLLQRLQPLDK